MGRLQNTEQAADPNPNPKPIQHNPSQIALRNSPLLLRVYADDQDKKSICIFWTVLFAIAILVAVVSYFALPAILVKNSTLQSSAGTSLATCKNPSAFSGTRVVCGSNPLYFGELAGEWGPANQFGLLYLEVRPSDLSQTVTINQNYALQLYDLKREQDSGGVYFAKRGVPQTLSAFLSFTGSKQYYLYGQDRKTVVGYQYLLAILTDFEGEPFLQIIKFTQSLSLPNSTVVNLQSYAINPKFTYYTIILRYVYFGLAILACLLYFSRYVRIPREKRIIEQKMVAVASVLLIMFNDPFYAITVLKPNPASAFFSLLFVVNLVAFLMLQWLVFADRICFEEGEIETAQLTKKKIAYAALVWALLLACLMVFTMQQIDHAPIVPDSFAAKYRAAQVIIGVVFFLGVGYVGFRFVRSCMSEGRSWRSTLYMVLASVFIFAVFIIVVTNSLILYSYSGPAILVIYTLVNVYLYYLQYMYTLTTQQLQELQQPPEAEHNYDAITVGTIELVDINLDEEDKSREDRNSRRREERRERESDKQEMEQSVSFE